MKKNKRRLIKSIKALNRSEKKLMKARAERIWIEQNTHINILNYPYYKLVRWLKNLGGIV